MKRYLLISIVLIFLLSLSVVIADETMPSNVSTGECPAYPIPDCKDGFVVNYPEFRFALNSERPESLASVV